MAQTNSDVVALQLEVVAPLVSEFYEFEDALVSRFTKMKSMDQSSRDLRIPIPMYPGGKFRQVDFDGGAMGRGSATVYKVATLAPIDQAIAVEINDKVGFVTDSSVKAVANAVQREVAAAMSEFKNMKDSLLQTAGGGILSTVATSGVSGTTITLTSPFYEQLLRYGQEITVYNSTQTTNRGTATITGIDPVAHTITVNATPGGTTDGDKICLGGLSGASPTSTYGLAYHHNSASTGTWLGLNRATYPGIRTPIVTASSTLTTAHPQLLLAKLAMQLGQSVLDSGKWFWHMHTSQRVAWAELGQLIQEISVNQGGAANGNVDILMQRKLANKIGGIEVLESIHADRTRIDLVDGENWIRGTYKETGLHKMGDQTKLPVYDNTGGYSNASIWYISNSEQFAVKNPRRGGYIASLTEVSALT